MRAPGYSDPRPEPTKGQTSLKCGGNSLGALRYTAGLRGPPECTVCFLSTFSYSQFNNDLREP